MSPTIPTTAPRDHRCAASRAIRYPQAQTTESKISLHNRVDRSTAVPNIAVKPLSPHVGAEIDHIDLTRPLSPAQVKELKDALAKHGVIFFHGQPIDLEMHRRFCMYFGELHVHVGGKGTASKPDEKYPEARRQRFDANSKRVSREVWHTDQSC